MAIQYNLSSLGSAYLMDGQERSIGDRKIFRYILSNTNAIESARQAIAILLQNNPGLFIASTDDYAPLVGTCPFLVINGPAVCLSSKEKAPEGIDPLCEDTFFSEAIIDEPIKCAEGHIFERKYIQAWVNSKGNQCPYDPISPHNVGQIVVDNYLLRRIKSLIASFQMQGIFTETNRRKLEHAEAESRKQLAVVNNLSESRRVQISYTIAPSQQPFARLYLQLTDDAQPFLAIDLPIEQKLQVFKRIAHQVSVESLIDVFRRTPNPLFIEVMNHVGFDANQQQLLKQKLRLFSSGPQRIPHFNTLPKFLESLETAVSYVYPDHNPQNLYEASQMLSMAGMAVAGLYMLAITTGGWGLLGVPVAVGGYKLYKTFNGGLPTEIPPAKNLTMHAVHEALPLIGRDVEIEQVFQSLASSGQGVRLHPLLVGSAGAGKTMIMQEVARRLALCSEALNLPQSLREGFVYFCTAADLLPAHPMEGSGKFDDFFRRIRDIKTQAVVAIDEVHAFLNPTHKDQYGQKIKSILDTSMNGIPYTLCATTEKEYIEFIQNDVAVARRFHVIKVPLLDKDHTIAALHQQVMTQFPGLIYDSKLLSYVYDKSQTLADKYPQFKQPEISKKVLSRAIAVIQSEIDRASPANKQLETVKGERAKLITELQFNTSIQGHEQRALVRIGQLDNEISRLSMTVSEEKEQMKIYKTIVAKIIESMKYVINLAHRDWNREEENLFKFLTKISIPDLFLAKCAIEKRLQIKPLNKDIIDAVVAEMDRNQIQ